MNRAEIIEGLKDIYGTLDANLYFRKALDLKIIEACLNLLENENALIDKASELIDEFTNGYKTGVEDAIAILEDLDLYKADEDGDLVACKWEVIGDVARLKGGEQ